MAGPGFAIIDFETTGLFPAQHDRVVEVAVVHLDARGFVQGHWDTLVNPERDLGPTRIHRITAAEILQAPTFAQIAPRLVALLSGRVLVAHNASFDTRFLIAELTRAGYPMAQKPVSLCTMRLARDFLPGSGRSLKDCCSAYDIELEGAHRALADAMATAELLRNYLHDDPDDAYWRDLLRTASAYDWPPMAVLDTAWVAREAASAPQPHFLQRISDRLPSASGPDAHHDYLALLDRCLLDRSISQNESDQLVALADDLGIDRSNAAALNGQYFDAVAQVAWEDGILTAAERADLTSVATALRIPPSALEAAMTKPTRPAAPVQVSLSPSLRPGDLVALTGEMRRPRAEWEALLQRHGLVPWASVTKKVKLVVAADTDTLSGKARKARDYGIPVIDERTLEKLVEV